MEDDSRHCDKVGNERSQTHGPLEQDMNLKQIEDEALHQEEIVGADLRVRPDEKIIRGVFPCLIPALN